MSTYVFAATDQSMVIRDGATWIAWDSVHGYSASFGWNHDKWVADGSPMPTAYMPPPLSTRDVDAFVKQRLATGYSDTETGKTWQCDPMSLIKWTALASAKSEAVMIAADNSLVTLDAPQVHALFSERLMPWVSATMLFARVMKDNILANNPPADITVGWP
jgi:hypothetical protein